MSAIDSYLNTIACMLHRVLESQSKAIAQAAREVATRIANGGLLYTFGTGHAHLLAEEMFYRAGGLASVYPVLEGPLMLHLSAARSSNLERQEGYAARLLENYQLTSKDVLLVISNSGRNAVPVDMAMLARQRGVFVIGLTSLAHSQSAVPRNQAGKRLFEVCDLVIDNLGVEGDAVLDFGDGQRIGASSTVMGAAILQSMTCQVKQISLEEGLSIDFFQSSNVDGGDAVNNVLIEKYHSKVHCL